MNHGGAADGLRALAWRVVPFADLTPRALQHIYALRQRVFVIEQNCPYLDVDGCDERALHLTAHAVGLAEPVAYARLLEPGVKYADASIGRVITALAWRGRGLGHELVRRALAAAAAAWPESAVRISAQSRLEAFYAGHGFTIVGERYIEDAVPHTEMLRAASRAVGG